MLMTGAKLARAATRLNAGLLILITDDDRLADPLAAARKLPKGSLVILRARDAKKRQALAQGLRRIPGLLLLAAGDPVLARDLDGLHLPEQRAREAAHWRAVRPGWIITVAAHALHNLHVPYADAALLSPVFATASHPATLPLGAARARLMAQKNPGAVIALGGVSARNAGLLKGFAGLAAISALA
jgi:thiamine-phosphate pyrophosphorylase